MRPTRRLLGNMAGRRIYSPLFVRYQQRSGLDFYYSALVVIFNISNSIRLRFRVGRFSNATTSPSRIRYQRPGQSTLKVKANMKHVFLILLTIVIVLTGIFLPYIHGDYDYFAAGLFYICQFAAFASLLLIPIVLICLITILR